MFTFFFGAKSIVLQTFCISHTYWNAKHGKLLFIQCSAILPHCPLKTTSYFCEHFTALCLPKFCGTERTNRAQSSLNEQGFPQNCSSWSPTERNHSDSWPGLSTIVASWKMVRIPITRLQNVSVPLCVLAHKTPVRVTRHFSTTRSRPLLSVCQAACYCLPSYEMTFHNCVASPTLCCWHLQQFLQTIAWTGPVRDMFLTVCHFRNRKKLVNTSFATVQLQCFTF
jgi:hypothetical protein